MQRWFDCTSPVYIHYRWPFRCWWSICLVWGVYLFLNECALLQYCMQDVWSARCERIPTTHRKYIVYIRIQANLQFAPHCLALCRRNAPWAPMFTHFVRWSTRTCARASSLVCLHKMPHAPININTIGAAHRCACGDRMLLLLLHSTHRRRHIDTVDIMLRLGLRACAFEQAAQINKKRVCTNAPSWCADCNTHLLIPNAHAYINKNHGPTHKIIRVRDVHSISSAQRNPLDVKKRSCALVRGHRTKSLYKC